MKIHKVFTGMAALVLLTSLIGVLPVGASPQLAGGTTRQIPSGGTTSPQTGTYTPSGPGDVTQAEFPGQMDSGAGPAPYAGMIVNRSQSKHTGNGASTKSGAKAKSNPTFNIGFQGLNLYQQRYARGGNQFTVEPPDQGLCVGNGFVVEAVNDVFNVYNTSGQSVLPDNTATNIVAGFPRNVDHAVDLNSFFGYAPAINRSTGVRAQFVTDPSCIYDAATQRFFLVVLTLETFPNGAFTTVNHLDLAVSQSSDPTGLWTIYRMDVTNDGSVGADGGPCPCLGDYPHIGADANGVYLTTNSYPWGPGNFDGAQIYALSKAQLAAGATSVNMVHIDTTGMVNATSPAKQTEPGFTVWPAQSSANQFDLDNGGTEFFMSSNAGAEAASHAFTGASTNLVVWTLQNTSSLNSSSPSVNLTNKVLNVNEYAIPPLAKQPGAGTPPTANVPQGFCINDTSTLLFNGQTGCWRLLFGSQPPHTEVISTPDANDTRMQQVTYANGKLWGALDTALNPGGGTQRAGIEYFIVNPNSSKLVLQGYLGAAGYDFTYPAIGVTDSGRGVMAFTAIGDNLFPSSGFAPIDAHAGAGPWSVVNGGTGAAQDDGFTGYAAQVAPDPIRTRWGDYSAAAVSGNSIWIASEYIASACNYSTWGGPFFNGGSGDNLLGTCSDAPGGVGLRSALGNWSTRISKLTP